MDRRLFEDQPEFLQIKEKLCESWGLQDVKSHAKGFRLKLTRRTLIPQQFLVNSYSAASTLPNLQAKLRTTLRLPKDCVIHSLRHTFLTRFGEAVADAVHNQEACRP